MKPYAELLATPLRRLNFSAECLRWFQDAGVHTVEDTEEHVTLLVGSPLYTDELMKEMVTVIKEYMAIGEVQRMRRIEANNNIIKKLFRLLKAKHN